METRCKFWLPKKNRFCANTPLHDSSFCGNHTPRSDAEWIPCPLDSSHSVLQDNLEAHIKRCPFLKQAQSLSLQPYYQKGINAGREEEDGGGLTLSALGNDVPVSNSSPGNLGTVTSEMKRNAVYNLSVREFYSLISKIKSLHELVCKDIQDSYKIKDACDVWIKGQIDRKLPFQEKHVIQQASILGNLEEHGLLKRSDESKQCADVEQYMDDESENDVPAVVEFGAGRGYLTQMLTDCYGIKRVFLVERKSYKLKADRSLRKKESLLSERLRIDIEDLNLNAVESLRGLPFLAIGKHLCGPATDLTLRCCLAEGTVAHNGSNSCIKGLAIATCCHHLCQWNHYINKKYFSTLGIKKEEFHAITWFTSWAVDADHSSDLLDVRDQELHLPTFEKENDGEGMTPVKDIIGNMEVVERAVLGFTCKQIIDVGRLMWLKERGLDAQLIKYVPLRISPENHLLVARRGSHD